MKIIFNYNMRSKSITGIKPLPASCQLPGIIYFRFMAFLQVNNIVKKEGDNFVVNHISFMQQRHQNIAVAGETGSGKTSLLKMIAGLMQPSSGEIIFENKKVTGPDEQLIPGHSRIAYMSQYFELRNNYWVYEILEMANKLSEKEAQKIYAVCQTEHLLKRRTNQLSGGEKQRIALARLLTTSPELLLLDEPFSNLDALHKSVIKEVIHDIGEELDITCIMVSHDPLDVLSWADIIIILKGGEIVQEGTPHQIYHQPLNEYCAGLFGEYNSLDTKKGKVLSRPGYYRLSGIKLENSTEAVVQNVSFFGSYYLVKLQVNDKIISVFHYEDNLKQGMKVYVNAGQHRL